MNCDAIAPYYRWIEFAIFGNALARCRTCFLRELSDVQRALVLGDGDGRFLQGLLDTSPGAQVDYVDRSIKMLELARSRALNERASFHCADILADELPDGKYDLVSAHFFFDCFDRLQLECIIRRVQSAAPHARWVVSEFRFAEGWLALPSQLLIGIMYRFFGMTTGLKTRELVDHAPIMTQLGLRPVRRQRFAGGLLVSEIWASAA